MCAWMVVLLVDDDELQHISSAYDDTHVVVDIHRTSWLKISLVSMVGLKAAGLEGRHSAVVTFYFIQIISKSKLSMA